MVNNNNNNKKKYKNFGIVDFPKEGNIFGDFKADIPKKAANDAFTYLFNVMSNDTNKNDFTGKFIVFVIQDKNNGKMYKYLGNRVKLENPVKNIKNGKVVYYYYKNVIGKYKGELDNI